MGALMPASRGPASRDSSFQLRQSSLPRAYFGSCDGNGFEAVRNRDVDVVLERRCIEVFEPGPEREPAAPPRRLVHAPALSCAWARFRLFVAIAASLI